jgi:hypothetical protein
MYSSGSNRTFNHLDYGFDSRIQSRHKETSDRITNFDNTDHLNQEEVKVR